MVRFPSRNQGVLNSSFIMTIEKTITIEDMKKPETHKHFPKKQVSRTNQRLISILSLHTLRNILTRSIWLTAMTFSGETEGVQYVQELGPLAEYSKVLNNSPPSDINFGKLSNPSPSLIKTPPSYN